jgi:hypothetical protein
VKHQFNTEIDNFDLNKEGVSTGTFLIEDHISDYEAMYNLCYEYILLYGKYLIYPEQGIFDLVFQKYNLENNELDKSLYCAHPNDSSITNNIKIFHGYGQPKFWNGLHNAEWDRYYQEWISFGGSKYKKKNRILKKFDFIEDFIGKVSK